MDGRNLSSLGHPRQTVKLLALHSFRTSGAILEKQMALSGFSKILREECNAEIVFIDAPNAASGPIPNDVVAAFPNTSYYEWWNATQREEDGQWEYVNADKSLEYIERVWNEHHGFDGIVGFSQGAAMAALLAGLQHSGQALTGFSKLKFIICIAGIRVRDPRFSTYYDNLAHIPSVHIIGQNDPIKRLTNQLIRSFQAPVVLTHDRGHVVPRIHDDMKRILVRFIESHSPRQAHL